MICQLIGHSNIWAGRIAKTFQESFNLGDALLVLVSTRLFGVVALPQEMAQAFWARVRNPLPFGRRHSVCRGRWRRRVVRARQTRALVVRSGLVVVRVFWAVDRHASRAPRAFATHLTLVGARQALGTARSASGAWCGHRTALTTPRRDGAQQWMQGARILTVEARHARSRAA